MKDDAIYGGLFPISAETVKLVRECGLAVDARDDWMFIEVTADDNMHWYLASSYILSETSKIPTEVYVVQTADSYGFPIPVIRNELDLRKTAKAIYTFCAESNVMR